MSSSILIRRLVSPDAAAIDAAAKALTSSFLEDQFTKVVTGGAPDVIAALKRAQLLSGLDGGEVWVAEDKKEIVGCAVWFGPGRAMFDTDEQKKDLLGPVFARYDEDIRKWWPEYFLPRYGALTLSSFGTVPNPSPKAADKSDAQIPYKLAAWHLQTVGVLPTQRKKGILALLVDALKKKVTTPGPDEGIPLCLEAISEANSVVYARLGFIEKGDGGFVGARPELGNFHFWCMVWEAGQAAKEKKAAL
ncbi:hypothetical protein BDV98DRAFT_577328 [Pterulicium gracile]|uniref:N-acetyltransferase domain-containing protein n=1 Tax=Pterulicium gracile TaxID=1884261 RepID=A0A5C3Q166_9AGAR|nr:hypothetical protein BDV98DRAFT_577328 [Pterula gracilis]